MLVTVPGRRAKYTFRRSEMTVTITADKASPTRVPPTPKREVKRAAQGEAIAPAISLGRSRIDCLCCSLSKTSSCFQLRGKVPDAMSASPPSALRDQLEERLADFGAIL